MGDSDGTGGWLTYDQIAEAGSIRRIGAVRLVQRHKWRRQMGNDGLARVLVPPGMLINERATRGTDAGTGGGNDAGTGEGNSPSTGRGNSASDNIDIAAFERALTVLREAKDGEIETLKGALGEARGRAERAEQALAAERTRADALRDGLDGAEARARKAEEAAAALRQAEAARQGRRAPGAAPRGLAGRMMLPTDHWAPPAAERAPWRIACP